MSGMTVQQQPGSKQTKTFSTMSSAILKNSDKHQSKLGRTTKSFVAGASSGMVSCVLFQPLDLLKTRLQAPAVSPEQIIKRNTLLEHTVRILKNDGVLGFWHGLTPSIYRTLPGVGLYFSTLCCVKSFYSTKPAFYENLLIGFSARAFVGALLLPAAVTKARFESGQFHYKTVPDALRTIWRVEGVRGLFSGCTATIARDAPFSGLYLMFYSMGKNLASVNGRDLGPTTHLSCGVVAGFVASIITHPADVVKTQLQLYPSRYTSTVQCFRLILSKHGVNGLFHGLIPRCMRRTMMSALSWTIFEQIMKKFDLKI